MFGTDKQFSSNFPPDWSKWWVQNPRTQNTSCILYRQFFENGNIDCSITRTNTRKKKWKQKLRERARSLNISLTPSCRVQVQNTVGFQSWHFTVTERRIWRAVHLVFSHHSCGDSVDPRVSWYIFPWFVRHTLNKLGIPLIKHGSTLFNLPPRRIFFNENYPILVVISCDYSL